MFIDDSLCSHRPVSTVHPSSDIKSRFEWFWPHKQLIFYCLPRISVEGFGSDLAIGSTSQIGQLVSIIKENFLDKLTPIVNPVLLNRIDRATVVLDGRKEKRGQSSSYLFVDVLELRFLYVELIEADLVHCVVLDNEDTVCKTVDTSQTETRVVGLQNDLS